MPKYYIHAEAFNLNHMVYDTNDISTIRGGSFILLDAVKRLPEAFPGLKSIATAASKGLFSYDDPGDLAAQQTGMAQRLETCMALPVAKLPSWLPSRKTSQATSSECLSFWRRRSVASNGACPQ